MPLGLCRKRFRRFFRPFEAFFAYWPQFPHLKKWEECFKFAETLWKCLLCRLSFLQLCERSSEATTHESQRTVRNQPWRGGGESKKKERKEISVGLFGKTETDIFQSPSPWIWISRKIAHSRITCSCYGSENVAGLYQWGWGILSCTFPCMISFSYASTFF